MSYEEMSDFEINKEVAIRKGFLVEQEPAMNDAVYIYFDIHNNEGFHKNYCSEPSDAWPIIVKNKIDIRFDWDEMDTATALICPVHEAIHANPLRAAMIAFLKMQESKND